MENELHFGLYVVAEEEISLLFPPREGSLPKLQIRQVLIGIRYGRQTADIYILPVIAGGVWHFWRVPIDQSTGEILGEPEIVPSPSKFNSHLSFSSRREASYLCRDK